MPDSDFVAARQALSPADYARVGAMAEAVVIMYGGNGPPFPLTQLWGLLQGISRVEPMPPGAPREGLHGCAFPVDYATYGRHALVYINSDAPPAEVFITAFHETGHVLLHILPPDAVPELRYQRGGEPPPGPRDRQAEAEVDLFVARAAMPAAWVHAHWPYACALAATPAEAVAWMAQLFSVPPGWMARRLRGLGLLAQ